MRYKVLLHAAVLLILAGSVKIIVERGADANWIHDLLSSRNLPLGVTVLFCLVLLELFHESLSAYLLGIVVISSLIYFISSFFLPLTSHKYEPAAIFAYITLLTVLSISIAGGSGKKGNVRRAIFVLVLIAFVGTSAGIIYTFYYPDRFLGKDRADAAVVLGGAVRGPHSPSPDLKARLDTAMSLFKRGLAEKIVVTGGTRRFNTFESEIGAWYLRSKGIPASKILTEDNTLNTSEQIQYVKRVLVDSLRMKRIVIVSDIWHLPRAMLMCKWEHVKARSYGSRYKLSPQADLYWRAREAAGIQVYILFGA